MTSTVVHLIDDDDGVRHSLAFLLATAGLAVRVYKSGVAFLAALGTLQPGCIVSDVRMPGIDGLELQRRLKSSWGSYAGDHHHRPRRCARWLSRL